MKSFFGGKTFSNRPHHHNCARHEQPPPSPSTASTTTVASRSTNQLESDRDGESIRRIHPASTTITSAVAVERAILPPLQPARPPPSLPPPHHRRRRRRRNRCPCGECCTQLSRKGSGCGGYSDHRIHHHHHHHRILPPSTPSIPPLPPLPQSLHSR